MASKKKGTSNGPGKQVSSPGKKRVQQYVSQNLSKADQAFHLKLKHFLGGVSLLSLLAAFEVFSIPAASGIIDLFQVSKATAGAIWIGVAALSGGFALYLYGEE